jgi:hypothetical protein
VYRSLTILAAIGLVITCAIIVCAVLSHEFMPTGRLIHIFQLGPVGLLLFRDGVFVTWHGIRKTHFNLYYVATLTAALPMAYLILDASKRRATRRRGFSVLTQDIHPAK